MRLVCVIERVMCDGQERKVFVPERLAGTGRMESWKKRNTTPGLTGIGRD